MLISETHFSQKSYLKIPNYNIYDTNHPDGKAHGGTAVIIKSTIHHFENSSCKLDFLQATSITVEDRNGPITFAAIYCPPKHIITQEHFNEFFDNLGQRFIAGGDYNAKHPWWGSRQTTPTPRGRQLYVAMQEKHLFPLSTGEPTYWPTDTCKTPDLIDFAILKGINLAYFTVSSCFDLSSDHSPVLISYEGEVKYKQKKEPSIQ